MLGETLGPYRILGKLGEGGMGEVFRATDTNLKRSVALKVLPAAVAGDADRLARFRREAEVLAALNHPNIAAIYGLEKTPDLTALVMELVEGDDLAERLERGAIPLDEALPIARQIAEALEAAHEQGIVHRDLKPANVKVRPDGTVKVLDFGLAKAMTPEGAIATADPTTSPTLTAHSTHLGMILGTAAYMAPEQARGKPVDRRADIWAFGVVLYEMLTGTRAFAGEELSDVLAAVLRQEFDWSALPAGTPHALRRLLVRCLERDPKRRLRDIGEARIAIEELLHDPRPVATVAAAPVAPALKVRPTRFPTPLVLGLTGAASCGAIVAWLFLTPPTAAPGAARVSHDGLVRATIDLPETAPLALGTRIPRAGFDSTALALSPDGRVLAYVGQAATGTLLYLRDLSDAAVMPVAGTEGAISPFFSHDGRWLGFLTDTHVKKVALGGGVPVTVCEAQTPVRARWTRDDTIYFSTDYGLGLWRIAGTGGRPERVDQPDSSFTRFSDVSLDGRWALRTDRMRSISGDYASVSIVPLAGGPARVVIPSAYDARFVGERTLVFARAATLHTIAFDPDRGVTEGESRPVAAGVAMDALFQQVHVAVSSEIIAYVAAGELARGRLAWVNERGDTEYLNAPATTYGALDLSDDGRRMAVHVGDVTDYVWIYDFTRREGRRLVVGESGGWPVWGPDGQTLAVRAWPNESADSRVLSLRDDGGGPPREIAGRAARPLGAYSWSPDGRVLALSTLGGGDAAVSFAGAEGATARATELTFAGHMPSFSPDGRFVAYTSVETGQVEVFVRSFPDGGIARQISTDGGGEPVWCPCGDLFYRNGNRWMSVRVRTQPDLQWDTPRLRFETDFVDTPGRSYDVSPDGRRLLVVKSATEVARHRIELVVNWRPPARADSASR